MASKRTGPSAIPKLTKTTVPSSLQPSSQISKSPPPTSTPFLTFQKLQEVLDDYTEKLMLKVRQFTDDLMKEFKEEMVGKIEELVKMLADSLNVVADKVQEVETKAENMNKKCEGEIELLQDEITMMQFKQMEFALRIRGLPEDGQEDLKVKVATSLAPVLGCDYGKLFEEIDSAYRINSRIAAQRNLPRDVVIYFSRKARRNEIIWTYYQQRFQIANQDIILLKEVPYKMLQKRKEFAFLTQELKNRQIPFRWNIPTGIMVTFDNKSYRLDTPQKAKDFYLLILKAEKASPSQSGEMGGSSKMLEALSVQGKAQTQQSEAREEANRIMTRAAYRRRVKGKMGT